jgi:CDP-diacylglycerol pyrophosphatase
LRSYSSRYTLSILLALVFVVGASVAAGAQTTAPRDVLWKIVTTCIELHAADYCSQCSLPRIDSPCGHGRGCSDTTEVWEETTDYVALRDVKMCGCEEGFVHGLVIPRSRVTGVEDPGRPEDIWSFAWDVARKRIREEAAIALAVNPQGQRSQNQLHVHIVRLAPDARQRFADARSARVRSLGDVWNAAAEKAALAGLKDYGVLVAKQPGGDFLVVIESQSPEKAYTRWECR